MTNKNETEKVAADRRRFLENCGRFAVVTPPTVALMLSAPGSVRAALAASAATTSGTSMTVQPTTGDFCLTTFTNGTTMTTCFSEAEL